MANPRAVKFNPTRRGRLFKSEEANIQPQSFEENLTPEDSTVATATLGKRTRAAAPKSFLNKRSRPAQSLDGAINAYHHQVNFILNHFELTLITAPAAKKKFVSQVLMWIADAYRTQKIVDIKNGTSKVNRLIKNITSLMLDAWELAHLMMHPNAATSLQDYIDKNEALYYRIQADKYGIPEKFKEENLNTKMIVAGKNNDGEVSDEVITENLDQLNDFFEKKMVDNLNILIREADKSWWKLLENFLKKQITEIENRFPGQQVEFVTDLKDHLVTAFEEWITENVNNPERVRAILATIPRRR